MLIPKHLTKESQAWWRHIAEQYQLEAHHERLLTLAAEAWDRCQQAREILKREGITVKGREGIRAHPCISIERDSRAAFASLVKQLQLDDDEGRLLPGRPAGVFHAANGKRLPQ